MNLKKKLKIYKKKMKKWLKILKKLKKKRIKQIFFFEIN